MEVKFMKIVKEITAMFSEGSDATRIDCEITTDVENNVVTISITNKNDVEGECITVNKSDFDAFVQEYIRTYNITAYATL